MYCVVRVGRTAAGHVIGRGATGDHTAPADGPHCSRRYSREMLIKNVSAEIFDQVTSIVYIVEQNLPPDILLSSLIP